MQVQHSSRHDFWETPNHILDLVREALGGINLDPASSERANRRVKADIFYTKLEDALIKPWAPGMSVYLNPPGGKTGNKSNTRLFWARMMQYREGGGLAHGVFAMFSVEGLQTTQGDHPCAMDFPICVPKKRVHWVLPGEDKSAPSHSNAFVYVPGYLDFSERFVDVFSTLGKCKL